MKDLAVIAHNIRSTHNIGSIFRTCECLGVKKLILSGYSPYPKIKNDRRLPHVIKRAENQIAKTALGAEKALPFEYYPDIKDAVHQLRTTNYQIYALEQMPGSVNIRKFEAQFPSVLILGEETKGIPREILELSDEILEITMHGEKESLNVSVAAGIAIYELLK